MICATLLATVLAAVPVIGNLADIRTNDVTIVAEEGTFAARVARAAFPERRFIECANVHDGILAVEGGKADVLVYDLPYLEPAALNRPAVRILDENLGESCISVGAPFRNVALMEKVNAFIRQFRADGTYKEMYRRWMQTADPVMPSIPEPANPEGTVRIGVTLDSMPVGYVAANGEYWGYDIEFSRRLALYLNRKVEFLGMGYEALLSATPMGKIDFGIAQFDATDERRKVMLFSDPYVDCPIGVMVRRPGNRRRSFGAFVRDGIRGTFLDEARWRLLAGGLGVTLEITFISALLGTILAFPLWLALISPIRPIRLLGRGWVEIMQGTPVLVMLMIVFYVAFADIDISPVLVAILVFGMNFSAYVGEIIGSGVSAVPRGQWEAAAALGYSRFAAFRKFVFPQALRVSLPVYRGMLISMLKETSVVGYITIHDLTKVSDLVRARTYDGFFPLVSTAVAYFVLAKLMASALARVGALMDPRGKERS